MALIERRWAARQYTTNGGGVGLSEWVFHQRGWRIVDLRKAWRKACEAAGVQGLLFHDLRRSGVRNMARSGVDQTVAMRISRHKTPSMYHRYNITSETDIERALTLTQETIRQAAATEMPSLAAVRKGRRS